MNFDPEIWGPHYWFFLHTLAMSYPQNPNTVTKKKYYDFFHNLPLFIPVPKIGNLFSELLDQYPITPYLDSRESIIKWVHYIHNKINIMINKPTLTYIEAMDKYFSNFKPKNIVLKEKIKEKRNVVYGIILCLLVILTAYLYNK